MKQKIITLFVIVLIAGLLSLVVIVSNNKEKQAAEQKITDLKNSEPIFYYGNTCPHCEIVEEWFEANQVEEKMTFAKKEVYANRENALELNKIAKECGLDTSSIGVPFLYADGQCLIGSPDIINYFSTKLGIDQNQASESAEQAL
jgi:glutaredoxin